MNEDRQTADLDAEALRDALKARVKSDVSEAIRSATGRAVDLGLDGQASAVSRPSRD